MSWDEMSQHYTVSVSSVLKMLTTSGFSCFRARSSPGKETSAAGLPGEAQSLVLSPRC